MARADSDTFDPVGTTTRVEEPWDAAYKLAGCMAAVVFGSPVDTRAPSTGPGTRIPPRAARGEVLPLIGDIPICRIGLAIGATPPGGEAGIAIRRTETSGDVLEAIPDMLLRPPGGIGMECTEPPCAELASNAGVA